MKRTLPLPRLLPGPPWPPRALRWVAADIAGVARQPEQDHRTHLRASVEWLCRAQDSARQEGLSEGWSFAAGWLPATPAATAALVETLLPTANYLVWPELKGRARALCGILLAQPNAASAGRVLGLIAAGMQMGETGALDRAAASGRLLVDAPFESPAACAHAAQALAMLGQVTGERFFFEGARACLARVARAAHPMRLVSRAACAGHDDTDHDCVARPCRSGARARRYGRFAAGRARSPCVARTA